MKTYRDITIPVVDTITCDVCKKLFTQKDIFTIQEFLHIDFIGGFDSVFGDGNKVTCDICQDCLKELLGKYLVIEEKYLPCE